MKRTIPCPCDNTFSVEVPEEIDLDQNPGCLGEILDGSFLNFTCPSCKKKHKPEFPLIVRWPDRKAVLEVLPETERGAFYRRKEKDPAGETVIGYPEMAERLAVYRDRREPAVIEALKYAMLLRAEETWPDEELGVWYQSSGPGGLEFHFHGFGSGDMAVSRLPETLYQKSLADFSSRSRGEVFNALRFRSYTSVRNALGEDVPGAAK